MKRICAGLLVLSVTLAVCAAEPKPAANQLTSKEIEEGWILLFDGETTFGWHSPNGSAWTVYEGMLSPQAGKPGLLVTNTPFSNYELKVEALTRTPQNKILLGHDADGKAGKRSLYGSVEIVAAGNWLEHQIRFESGRVTSQFTTSRGTSNTFFSTATKSAVFGGNPQQETLVAPGYIALSGNSVIFRNIKLRPLGTKPIFNGRDLTGWKEHPGKKSVFSVAGDGSLNIKNGPGDLQTEAKWSDFVLQLDCISNGKHLNSGVFFRCRPGEYQQGYEAQIHNGWLEKADKDYTIEEYDPQTNEPKEKTKIKSAAMDYGTGAIYRRMPARRQVAKDNEWFAMTVVAHGRHLSTWVNGIQVVDWTDNRPVKDNARNGCRLEAGPISLQGHDPTTDLSFRNLRIETLAERKVKGIQEGFPDKKE